MAPRQIKPLDLSDTEHRQLSHLSRLHERQSKLGMRVRMILSVAGGSSLESVAHEWKCSTQTVQRWVTRFREHGVTGLSTKPSGTPLERKKRPRGRAHCGQESTSGATLRTVAIAAGVSTITASRVLNGRPNVRDSSRERVMQAAREQGYRPDPELGKLMTYLRRRRIHRSQGSICALTSGNWYPGTDRYSLCVMEGARQAAIEQGFSWKTISLEELVHSPSHITRVLAHRGVDGLIFAPLLEARSLPPTDFWKEFSVMLTTYGISKPGFHRVVPDHFGNMLTVCAQLREMGSKRIGLLISRRLDVKVKHHYSGAFAAFHAQNNEIMVPMYLHEASIQQAEVDAWMQKNQPDAIIVSSSWAAHHVSTRIGASVSGPMRFATLGGLDFMEGSAPGIDELPHAVGRMAAIRLSRMILRGEKGAPEHPTVTLIEGEWRTHESPAGPTQGLTSG